MNLSNTIKKRIKYLQICFNYLFFSLGGKTFKDKLFSFYLRSSMDNPYKRRSNFVMTLVDRKGSVVYLCHKYFNNLTLSYNLLDNFEMAICNEFFIQNTYNLSRLKFIPKKIIDCGAYRGYFSFLALKKFPNASITAIEAHPGNFEIINNFIILNNINNIELLNGAICRSDNIFIDLYFEGSNGSMDDSFGFKSNVTKVKTIDLEHIINQENLLLKVDIEGAELDFFPSIINKLPSKCAVFLETHNGWESLQTIKEKFISEGFTFEIIRERSQYIDSFAQRK
jgi:FkbM family methyltransferase